MVSRLRPVERAEGAAQIDRVLDAYKVAHIVMVGRPVQRSGRIRPRFGNKVFLIDTGMLNSYYPGGRASALEICGDSQIHCKIHGPGGSADRPHRFTRKGEFRGCCGVEDTTKVSEKHDQFPTVGGICPATAPLPR